MHHTLCIVFFFIYYCFYFQIDSLVAEDEIREAFRVFDIDGKTNKVYGLTLLGPALLWYHKDRGAWGFIQSPPPTTILNLIKTDTKSIEYMYIAYLSF